MSLVKRLAVIAFFLDIPLCIISIGLMISGDFSAAWPVVPYLMLTPLLAFPLLPVGYLLKWQKPQALLCRTGLGLFAVGLLTVLGSWHYVYGGVVYSYADLQSAQVQNVQIYYDDYFHADAESSQLAADDAANVVGLVQQLEYCNPYFSTESTDYLERTENDAARLVLQLDNGEKIYVDVRNDELLKDFLVYQPGDKESCRQIYNLYQELKDKYYPSVAALE